MYMYVYIYIYIYICRGLGDMCVYIYIYIYTLVMLAEKATEPLSGRKKLFTPVHVLSDGRHTELMQNNAY